VIPFLTWKVLPPHLPLFAYPRPNVADIKGQCNAGGLITALGRAYRIASEGALEFSLNEVPIGISSSMRLVTRGD
jgi:enoyl-CoA hydratase/carnithine racemase